MIASCKMISLGFSRWNREMNSVPPVCFSFLLWIIHFFQLVLPLAPEATALSCSRGCLSSAKGRPPLLWCGGTASFRQEASEKVFAPSFGRYREEGRRLTALERPRNYQYMALFVWQRLEDYGWGGMLGWDWRYMQTTVIIFCLVVPAAFIRRYSFRGLLMCIIVYL